MNMTTSRVCVLILIVLLNVIFIDSLNVVSNSLTEQQLLNRPKRHSARKGWIDKILGPLRSVMGTRAYDPWRYFIPVKKYKSSESRSSSSSFTSFISPPASIPAEFDARTEWPFCPTIREIFEQGPCASCWAVTPTDVMSDRICIRSGGRHIVRLSAGNLLSCCRACGSGCKGGFPGGAWMYWKKHGIVTGSAHSSNYGCQSYQFVPCYQSRIPGTPKTKCPQANNTFLHCRESCRSSYNRSFHEDLYYGESVYRLPNNVEAIQLEIMEHGPVQANLRIYEDFLYYRSGVYRHIHGEGLEYHAVKLFGWGTDKDGTPYWLAANPWSKRWGDGGFFKILRGSNHAEIEAHVMAGIPKLAPEDVYGIRSNLI